MFLSVLLSFLLSSLNTHAGDGFTSQCASSKASAQVPFDLNYCVYMPKNLHSTDILYVFPGRGNDEKDWLNDNAFKAVRSQWASKNQAFPVVVSFNLPNQDQFWLLTPKVYDVFLNSLIPGIESAMPFHPDRRLLLGKSMGGFNILQFYFKDPERFSKVAAVCPMLPTFVPQQSDDKLKYVFRTGAFWPMVEVLDLGIVKYAEIPKQADLAAIHNVWDPINPLSLASSRLSSQSLPLFLAATRQDMFGFFEGTRALFSQAKASSAPVTYYEEFGEHCGNIHPKELADFLQN